jgi:hypothetical protein
VATFDQAAMWTRLAFEAKRATLAGQDLVDAARDYLNKMRDLEAKAADMVSKGLASSADSQKATYYRLDAQITLADLGG